MGDGVKEKTETKASLASQLLFIVNLLFLGPPSLEKQMRKTLFLALVGVPSRRGNY